MPEVARARPHTVSKPRASGRRTVKRQKAPTGKAVRPARTTKSTLKRVMKEEEISQGAIGPNHLTRFEKARILGARALQLSYGAPPLVPLDDSVRDPISIAKLELETGALPISIRRILPTGEYQNIPLKNLLG
ncbi:MAG: DNA-directed RNA polymerase subunit K [Conexivisphaerales archaeon]